MMGDEGELRHVELAEDDRARLLESLDGGRGARGYVPAEDARRAAGRRDAVGVEDVLHRDRDPVQQAELAAVGERLLGPSRRAARVVGGDVEVAMDAWIDA